MMAAGYDSVRPGCNIALGQHFQIPYTGDCAMKKRLALGAGLFLVFASLTWYGITRAHPQSVKAQKAQPQAGEARKSSLTLGDADVMFDKVIGMLKMEVATQERLQTWYEIDRDHPEAIKLHAELCAMDGGTMEAEKDALSMGQSPEFQALTKSLTDEQNYDLMAKISEAMKLQAKSNTLGRQLLAMGFNCGVKNEK